MSIWKKIYNKIKKTAKVDPKKLQEDKYLKKLKKQLKKYDKK